jgi:hypothetical protein
MVMTMVHYSDDGWLTLCGLDWLQIGDNKVGSDESCTVRLPATWYLPLILLPISSSP